MELEQLKLIGNEKEKRVIKNMLKKALPFNKIKCLNLNKKCKNEFYASLEDVDEVTIGVKIIPRFELEGILLDTDPRGDVEHSFENSKTGYHCRFFKDKANISNYAYGRELTIYYK